LKPLRIGTRGSALALWQARSISESLRIITGIESELVIVKTSGDKFQQTKFSDMGTKGVFIKELEDALLERRVDLAVHSMKDVPTEIPDGLTIAAICKRHDVRDALLSRARALVMPSPFESLSMVLLEAWNRGLPALVNARCKVLRGQVEHRPGARCDRLRLA